MGEGGGGMGGLECIGVRGDWLGTGMGWSDGGGLHPLACMVIPLMLTDYLISAILRMVVCRGRPAPSNPSPSLPPLPPVLWEERAERRTLIKSTPFPHFHVAILSSQICPTPHILSEQHDSAAAAAAASDSSSRISPSAPPPDTAKELKLCEEYDARLCEWYCRGQVEGHDAEEGAWGEPHDDCGRCLVLQLWPPLVDCTQHICGG